MDRRTFLKTGLKTGTAAAAASSATVGVAGSAQAAQAVTAPSVVISRLELRIAVPAQGPLGDAALAVMRDIEAVSKGRIAMRAVDVMPTAASIESGDCDGALAQLTEICGAPELALFSGLPGTMAVSPANLLAWHEAAGGKMFLDEALAQRGLAAFITGHSGEAPGFWASQEVAGLREFAAAEVETTGLGCAVVERISAAYGQSTGRRDGAVLVEAALDPLQALSVVPPATRQIWYRDSLHSAGIAYALVLSRDSWKRLDAGDQLLIETVARAAAQTDIARIKVSDRLMLPTVMNSLPIRRVPLAADIVTAIEHAARQVVHDAMGRSGARNGAVNRAFAAYGAYYEAMLGVPLPRPTPESTGLV